MYALKRSDSKSIAEGVKRSQSPRDRVQSNHTRPNGSTPVKNNIPANPGGNVQKKGFKPGGHSLAAGVRGARTISEAPLMHVSNLEHHERVSSYDSVESNTSNASARSNVSSAPSSSPPTVGPIGTKPVSSPRLPRAPPKISHIDSSSRENSRYNPSEVASMVRQSYTNRNEEYLSDDFTNEFNNRCVIPMNKLQNKENLDGMIEVDAKLPENKIINITPTKHTSLSYSKPADKRPEVAQVEAPVNIKSVPAKVDPAKYCKARYTFEAAGPRELSFKKKDIIKIRREVDANWLEGELKGQVGIFPANYVEILEDKPLDSSPLPPPPPPVKTPDKKEQESETTFGARTNTYVPSYQRDVNSLPQSRYRSKNPSENKASGLKRKLDEQPNRENDEKRRQEELALLKEQRKLEQEKARLEEERLRLDELRKEQEEEKRRAERRRRKDEEEKRRREEEAEMIRKEEERKRREEEERQAIEEARKREEQKRIEEARKREEQKRIEEAKRRAEEKQRKEEEERRIELAEKKKREEQRRIEERKRIEEERKRVEEERKRIEEERKKEERRKKEEERCKKEEERLLAESRRREEQERRREEEEKRREEERKDAERRRAEEERKRKVDERKRKEEEARLEEERIFKEEEQKREEERKKREEERRKELERLNNENTYRVSHDSNVHVVENTINDKSDYFDVKAKYSFKSQTDSELSFKKGTIITVTDVIDENWYFGKIGSREGMFPVSYVDKVTPSPEDTEYIEHVQSQETYPDFTQNSFYDKNDYRYDNKVDEGSSDSSIFQEYELYIAQYEYQPKNSDELQLHRDDVIEVIERCDDGWYVGTSQRTELFGTFPGNYVTPYEDP